ncbi:MAG: nuclear transport factor 2 family protein [Chloroflexia bacterium]|nr:nuclear transport factor 2 family protein [Chloroflexia bacterium]
MATTNDRAVDEAEVRALIEDRAKAVRARDIDGAMSNVAPDVQAFDVVNSLRYSGSEAARERLEEWFASFDYEIRDLSIATGGDVAFCHSLNRVSGTKVGGGGIVMWLRATVGYRKIDGTWLVAHEHSSVPFDPESGMAALDLEP